MAVIGAGMGGLAAALRLAAGGCAVTVLERAPTPGGKLRQVAVGGRAVDSGPTVLTMRWVFEDLFAAGGADLADKVPLVQLERPARHFWDGGARLDLHADTRASEAAIGEFAGAAAALGFRAFAERARRCHDVLRDSFMTAPRPTALSLTWRTGLGALRHIAPFQTLWQVLGEHFDDPRLRQLFGRYATYCGAVPMAAPATLMLVAHVESEGVWVAPGGLHGLATAVASEAARHGAVFRYGAEVAQIRAEGGRAAGVRLADGEVIPADAVVANADAAALATGLFGESARVKTDPVRSLSAVTCSAVGAPRGVPLLHHNVFFSDAYEAEFADIAAGRLPASPSVYVCAADRLDEAAATGGAERLFAIVNAPALGDRERPDTGEIAQCEAAMIRRFRAAGLEWGATEIIRTGPPEFARMFPATGGALYGPATHGPYASFRRPGAWTRLPGLYLAGGSVHPGPGLPMAALSGRMAALTLLRQAGMLRDGRSSRRSRRAATGGGTSMG